MTLSALLLASLTAGSLVSAKPLRGAQGPSVATAEVETSISEMFETIRASNGGSRAARLTKIESSVWQTFQSLPKNAAGRLSPRAVRYLVHGYFAKTHGWVIRGLEPSLAAADPNVTEVHGATILQDQAPALVEALLEARQSGRGLALEDVVVMIATLEHLVLHQSVSLLEASYAVNGLSSLKKLGQNELEEVLTSYLILFGQGAKANLADGEYHRELKSYLRQTVMHLWNATAEYGRDHLLNNEFLRRGQSNPFGAQRFPFETAVDVVQDIAHGYGQWQNGECVNMKDALVRLESPKGSGRVSLGNFYSGSKGKTWQFTESVETLREIGALDETSLVKGPQVLISNYLAQPTNCIATSAYYSVCCLNECEAIMNEIEHAVQAPAASADRLLGIVGNVSSATVDAPRRLPEALNAKLRKVAAQQGGDVALHGRLFSQWLHFAFPNECAYPHTEGAGTLAASEWFNVAQQVNEITVEEREKHAQTNPLIQENAEAASLLPQRTGVFRPKDSPSVSGHDAGDSLSSWTDEESYHLGEKSDVGPTSQWWRTLLRLTAQLAALFVVVKTLLTFMGRGARQKQSRAWSSGILPA